MPDPDEDEAFLLTVPVTADWHTITRQTTVAPTSPLADLMGTTRATVMIALAERERTTSELARSAHISVASASEHASVLRVANLITSTRHGNRMIHRLTALGTVRWCARSWLL